MTETNGPRPRILVIDDMVVNQMLLSSQLGALNVETDVCSSGEQGVELFRNKHYDLILMDWHIPDMDGREAFSQLKELCKEQGHEVPVICETSDDSPETMERLKKEGFTEVLVKPVDFGELHDMMVRCLGDAYSPVAKPVEKEMKDIEEAYERLPEWLTSMQGMDVRLGLANCGGDAWDYMDALAIFAASIDEKTKTVKRYLETENSRIEILRLHSLRCGALLVGAVTLAEQAAALEMAGKVGNDKALKTGTESLIAHYEELENSLKEHLGSGSGKKTALPPITEDVLADTYGALLDAVKQRDEESVDDLISSLQEYELGSKDVLRLESMRVARRRSDWDLLEATCREAVF